MIIRKSQPEIERMAAAGESSHETIALVGEHIEPGVTTLELDRDRRGAHRSRAAAYPTSKGYRGFPEAICISPNSWSCTGSRATTSSRTAT